MTTLTDFLKVDGVNYPLAEYFNFLYATALRAEMTNTETIAATKELTDNDVQFQVITASGADRTVELAPEATSNHVTIIENGGSSNHVLVKDDSGTVTFVTLAPGDWALFFPMGGTAWRFIKERTDEWIEVGETWTYASASTITAPTDATTRYQKWDQIRFKQGGSYKYFVLISLTSTVLTMLVNTDFAVANSAITDIAYSRSDKPFGFPDSFNFTPSWTNFTTTTATITAKVSVAKGSVTGYVTVVFGASTAITGSLSLILPIAAAGNPTPIGLVRLKDFTGGSPNAGVLNENGTVQVLGSAATYATQEAVNATVPFTWATSDAFQISFAYLAA